MTDAAPLAGPPAGRLTPEAIAGARSLASALPDLMVEARDVASTVTAGWHGRRRAGTGEDFWQFRPFHSGESTRTIDWRRSGRDDTLFVRERELENAHTVWLWTDLSASMDFRSALAPVGKRDRGIVLMLALAELLARSGERIGLLGDGTAMASRMSAERLAGKLMLLTEREPRPGLAALRRGHDVVVFSDFLDAPEAIDDRLAGIRSCGARLHMVQLLDPVEETFPFSGRTEFVDPETATRLTAGRAETWRAAYLEALAGQRARLMDFARRPGWSFLLHHTDRSASEPLLALHARLSATPQDQSGDGGEEDGIR